MTVLHFSLQIFRNFSIKYSCFHDGRNLLEQKCKIHKEKEKYVGWKYRKSVHFNGGPCSLSAQAWLGCLSSINKSLCRKRHMQSFGTIGNIFNIPTCFQTKIALCMGKIFFLIILWWNSTRNKERERKIETIWKTPFIVATMCCLKTSRTAHALRTNQLLYSLLKLIPSWHKQILVGTKRVNWNRVKGRPFCYCSFKQL